MAGKACISEEGFSPLELAAGRDTGLGMVMLCQRHRQGPLLNTLFRARNEDQISLLPHLFSKHWLNSLRGMERDMGFGG